jgi:hypothetical protein
MQRVKAFISKYAILLGLGLLLLLMVACAIGGYRYAHKDVAVVQGKLDAALKDVAQRDAILKDCDAATAAAQKLETEAKKRELKAGKDLADFMAQKPKTEIIFLKKTTELTKQPECSVLKEHLCPAAMGY